MVSTIILRRYFLSSPECNFIVGIQLCLMGNKGTSTMKPSIYKAPGFYIPSETRQNYEKVRWLRASVLVQLESR